MPQIGGELRRLVGAGTHLGARCGRVTTRPSGCADGRPERLDLLGARSVTFPSVMILTRTTTLRWLGDFVRCVHTACRSPSRQGPGAGSPRGGKRGEPIALGRHLRRWQVSVWLAAQVGDGVGDHARGAEHGFVAQQRVASGQVERVVGRDPVVDGGHPRLPKA